MVWGLALDVAILEFGAGSGIGGNAYQWKYAMEIPTPSTTTIPRSTEGRTRSATNPPIPPPTKAPIAITAVADHMTLPEKRKKMAAATFTHNAITCFRALSRVRDSCDTSASTASTITLSPPPKYPP